MYIFNDPDNLYQEPNHSVKRHHRGRNLANSRVDEIIGKQKKRKYITFSSVKRDNFERFIEMPRLNNSQSSK